MTGRLCCQLITLALVLAAAAPGAAKKRTVALVSAGVSCYESLNFGCAIGKLGEARKRLADNPSMGLEPAQKLRLFQTLAFALASVERHDKAVEAFERCFDTDPVYRLDPKVISPKIYGDYARARKRTLQAVLKGGLRLPRLPDVHPPPPPQPDDFRVHVPAYLTLTGMHDTGKPRAHDIDFLVGVNLLFGEDAEQFTPGFSTGLQYLYSLTPMLQIEILAVYSQHNYTDNDAKDEYPSTLYTLQPGAGLRLRFPLGEYVVLASSVVGGVSAIGLGGLGDRLGGFVSVGLHAILRPSKEFGVGLTAMPTLVMAEKTSGDLGTSFTLPLFLRLAAYF